MPLCAKKSALFPLCLFFTLLRNQNCGSGRAYSANLSPAAFAAGDPVCLFCANPIAAKRARLPARALDTPKKIGPLLLPLFLLFFIAEIADLAGLIPPIFPLLLLQPGTPFAYFAPIPLPQNVRACRRGRSRAKEDWPARPASFFTLLRNQNCGSGQAYSANLLLPSPTVPSTLWHPASARSHTAKRRRSV